MTETNNRPKEMRLLAAEIKGEKIKQQEASSIVHAHPRAWQAWESGERKMGKDTAELFCLKTGIAFREDLFDDDKPLERKTQSAAAPASAPVMRLSPADLHQIGHTTHGNEKGTNFVCASTTFSIEGIFLREILAPLGFSILAGEDTEEGNVEFTTNLPIEEYYRLTKAITGQLTTCPRPIRKKYC